jgi:hypothetical protein
MAAASLYYIIHGEFLIQTWFLGWGKWIEKVGQHPEISRGWMQG